MYPFTGTATINLDATNNRVQGNLDTYITIRAIPSRNSPVRSELFQFGSTGSSGAINSGYVDYNNFYANTPNNYVVNGKPINGVLVSANGALVNQAHRQRNSQPDTMSVRLYALGLLVGRIDE